MPTYELTFELPAVSEEQEDALVDATDGVIAEHYGVTTVTIDAQGEDFISAVRASVRAIEATEVTPSRLVMDLVSRSEIAERAGVTRQAVGNWVSGQRQQGVFPAPFVLSGGGLWLWAEVVPALRSLGLTVDEDLTHPTRSELEVAAAMLARRPESERPHVSAHSNWLRKTEGAAIAPEPIQAPRTVKLGFALVA